MKILIADDSSFMRTIIKNYLKGFDDVVIEEASDGQDALDKVNSFRPDFVLLDIIMPKINGIDVLKEIRRNNPSIKVVMVTSIGQNKMIEEALRLGAIKFVTKPFKYEDIIGVINEFR
jgi:two-component system, chemotaxis family, chemotaxis protein CheY